MNNEKVRPGEIISSDLMNFILDKLDSLEETLNDLGNTSGVRIDQISPGAGGLVGGLITVTGANFLHPPSDNVVRIGGQLVTEYASPSTSSVLTFRVPDSINISNPQGEEVVLRIQNSEFGTTEATYRLFPQSSQAPINIVSVLTPEPDNSPNLSTGLPAVITGTNFSTDENLNQIRLERVIGGQTVTHEVTEKAVLSPNSSGQMRIQFEVPDIDSIPEGQIRPATLVLTFGEQSQSHPVVVRRVV